IKHVVVDPAKLKLLAIVNGKWPALTGYKAPMAAEITSD
ncbi:MAG: sialidase, partial [Chitinophagaceae bacterium]